MVVVSEPVNPGGTASYGAVVKKDGHVIWECSDLYKPDPKKKSATSNNVAEYSGFIAVLEFLISRDWQREPLIIRADSAFVINQMLGRWKMRAGYYIPLAEKAKKLLQEFTNYELRWIPREQNELADKLSKAELVKAGVKFKIQPLEV